MRVLLVVLVLTSLSPGCTSSTKGCPPEADCPHTVYYGGDPYLVGCLPGGVREDLLGAEVSATHPDEKRYADVEVVTFTFEARRIEGVDVDEAFAIQGTVNEAPIACDSHDWAWALAPDLPSERVEELADRVATGE